MLYPSVISLIPRKKKKKHDTYSTILYILCRFFFCHSQFCTFSIFTEEKEKPTYEKIHTILLSKKDTYNINITVSYLY